jgi:hypothetical protein
MQPFSRLLQANYFLESILYMPVPHFSHLPLTAGRPFFMVTCLISTISDLDLHFTQYAFSAISLFLLALVDGSMKRTQPIIK